MTTLPTQTDADPAAPQTPDVVALSRRGVASLVELLDHCYAFLDTHPTARFELTDYCSDHPEAVTSTRVIDQLGWHALLLRLQLAEREPCE